MSYLVLARKYRPRCFGEMVGQEHVVRALGNALTTGRLHHAWMFTGTRGVGKTTVARILAKSLNCTGADGTGGVTAQPCGVCQACADIDAGRFVDYTELDAASNRGVDEVQGLLEQAVYKPVQGRFKVFMIDEVHMLTHTAFNAMLKTLEEPPEYLKFVLATTDPQKVPVTVLSRCLQFNLRPMAPDTIFAHLRHVLQAEDVQAQDGALHLIARAARGSMRDALSLTDQAIAFGAGHTGQGGLQEDAVRQMLGSVDSGHVLRLIEALAQGQGAQAVEVVQTLQTHGLSAAHTLEEMSRVLQRMALWQLAPQAAVQAGTDPDEAEIRRLGQGMAPDETQLLYSMCLQGRQELGLAPDEYAALCMIALRFFAFKPPAQDPPDAPPRPAPAPEGATAEKKSLKSAPTPPEPPASPPPPPPPPPPPEPPAASPQQSAHCEASSPADAPAPEKPLPPLQPTDEGQRWFDLVRALVRAQRISGLAREMALQGQLVAHTPAQGGAPAQWRLRLGKESLLHAPSHERLQAALAQELGGAVQLHTELGPTTDTPALRRAHARAREERQAQAIVQQNALVQSLVRHWAARIVPGSVRIHAGG